MEEIPIVRAVVVSLLLSGLTYAQEAPPVDEQVATADPTAAADLSVPATRSTAPVDQPAPTHLFAGAKVFIEVAEGDQFGMALGASFLEKKVPLAVVNNPEVADFTIKSASDDRKGSTVGKIFGVSRDRYHATISIYNSDGILVFAYNVKKNTFQDAANSTANEIKKKGIKG